MSATIDEKVVEMRFDNKQFESNAKESIGTIEKLKQVLNFSDSTKNFDNLQNAANKVNMSGLGDAVESVKMKFSALEVIAITALTNITNRAVNAGIQLAKSLSVDQISAGFGEYELKMGSIQTIMASTGESLDTVNDYLEELNHYADKTIYSFSDMTNNIGKFTNAGVKLEDAVKAIQGISNEAAVSGANANEASRAMYNFAQALSAGYVKLIDWKSIENANMATVEFKQALLDTAVALGTVVKEGDDYRSVTTDANGKVSELFNSTMMFNDSLSSQWMTTEVLVQTLGNYSTDIREMTDAEREAYEEKLRSIGYTEEQIKKVEDLGQKAFDAAQDVKTFSQLMDTLKESVGSGWAQTFELLIGDFEEAKSLWTNVNNVIGDILQQQADARNDLIKGWKDAGGRDALMQGIANSWRGIVAIIKPIKEAFTDIFPPATVDQVVNLTKGFQNFTEKLTISEETSDKLKRTFTGLFSAIDIVGKVAKSFFEILFPGVKIVGGFADNLLTVTAALGDWVTNLNKSLDENKTFEKSVDKIRNVVDLAFTKFKDFLGVIKEWTDSHFKAPDLSFVTDFTDTVETRFSPLKTLFNVTKKVTSSIVQVFKKSAPILVTIASAIGNALSSLGSRISEAFTTGGFNAVLDLFNSGILAAIGLNVVDFVKNLSSVANEGKGFIEGLSDIKEAIVDTFGAIQSQLKAKALLSIAGAIGILTASLVVLSLIDSDKLTTSLGAVTAIFIELFTAMGVYSKVADTKKVNMGGLITFALSVGILSTALLVVSKIPVRDLISGLTGIAGLAVVLDTSIILLQKASSKYKAGKLKGLMSFAISIGLLTIALKNVTDIPVKDLISGMVGITSLAAVMDVSIIALQKSSSKYKKGSIKGLMSFAVSIGLLTIALNNVTDIPVKDLISGLTGITALAVIMDASIILMQAASSKYKEGSIKGLISFAVSLGLLTISLNSVSKIPVKDLISGLAGIAGLATVMGVTLGALTAVSSKYNLASMLAVAASLTVMATSILILTPALKILGNMEISEMVKSIGMLAAAFAVLGGAALILSPLTPVILALSGALTLLGIGLAGIGAGILAFSAGMSSLSLMSMTAATTAVATLQIIILGFLNTIANSGEAFGNAIKTLILTLCDVIVSCVPAIVDTIMVVIKNVVKSLAENTPEIVHYILEFIIGTLNAISADMPEVIKAVVNLVMSIFDGVIDALKGLSTSGLTKGIAGIALLSGLMVALSAMASLAPSAMVGVLAMGAVIAELTIVLAAIGALSKIPGLNWLIGEGGNLLETIGVAIGRFIGGIVGGFGSGVSSQFPKIGSDLAQFMDNVQPFIEGAKSIDAKAMDGVNMLAQTVIVLTAADILEGLTSWFTGESSITEFGKELAEFGPYFNSYYESIKNIDGQVVTASANASLALAEMAKNLPNQGGIVSWFAGENSLSTFAEELTEFGPKLKAYSDSIKGLDAEVVVDSANAALALAEMAKNLPNQGGIVSWFTGENKISDFGKELSKFGPVLKQYSDSVKGLDVNVVKASTNAALALAEMAKNLPNKGGIVTWFIGDNTLSDFGEELTKFGPKLKTYSNSISGMKTDVVTKSATAASSLAEMAQKLPNKGGIVTWFIGDNTLSDFGEELAEFGPYIAKYSTAISGIKSDAIVTSANAAKALAELANNLPNSGGLFSLFSGNKDISSFGKDLVKFGGSIADYYTSIKKIDGSALNQVAEGVKKLVEIAKGLKNVDSSSLKKFGGNLKKMGSNGMKEFIKAFENAESDIEKKFKNIAKLIVDTLEENLKSKDFEDIGVNSINSLIKGISSKEKYLKSSVNRIINFIIDSFSSKLTDSEFQKVGSQIISGLVNGITGNVQSPRNAISYVADWVKYQAGVSLAGSNFYNIGSTATNSIGSGISDSMNNPRNAMGYVGDWVNYQAGVSLAGSNFYNIGSTATNSIGSGISSRVPVAVNAAEWAGYYVSNGIQKYTNYGSFYGIGTNVADGLSGGINAKINSMANAAIAVGLAVIEAAKRVFGVHSPSRVFAGIGNNVSIGLANGILDKVPVITSAGEDLANSTIDPVKEALKRIYSVIEDGELDYDPVIKPVLDLSDVTEGISEISGLFSGLNLSTTMDLMQAASSSFSRGQSSSRVTEDRERKMDEKLDRLIRSSEEEGKTENYNNFYIQSTDPKQAAEEVGYIMQHKIERGRAAWAK